MQYQYVYVYMYQSNDITKHNDSDKYIYQQRYCTVFQGRRIMLRAWIADDSFRKLKLIINGIEDSAVYVYIKMYEYLLVVQLDISKGFL